MSSGGALIVSPGAFVAGTRVDLRPWDGAEPQGDVVRCEELPGPPGRAWRLGLRLEQPIDLTATVAAPDGTREPASAAA
jgi:hypothetical protein